MNSNEYVSFADQNHAPSLTDVRLEKNAGWAISEILQFPDVNADKIWYDIRYEISNRRNCGKMKQLPGQDNETAGDRNEREN